MQVNAEAAVEDDHAQRVVFEPLSTNDALSVERMEILIADDLREILTGPLPKGTNIDLITRQLEVALTDSLADHLI